MKILTCLLMIAFAIGASPHPARASSDGSAAEVTIELRDGTRVVGQGSSDTVNFHSSQMGELKLKWADILSLEFLPNTDFAKLILANGDVCQVHFADDTVKMETSFGPKEIPAKEIKSIKVAGSRPAAAPDKTGPLLLTIELQDGSRLIGTIHDDTLIFKSVIVGEVKLPWANIRTVECPADNKPAHLTAENGDEFTVDISAQTLHLETILGKIDLPVKLIRRVHVSHGGATGEHLVGWWKFDEGGGPVAEDSSEGESSHNGTISDVSMWTQSPDDGRLQLGFNGGGQNVSLGNILQAAYPEISIACWVKVGGTSYQTIIERAVWDSADGLGLIVDGSSAVIFGHYSNTMGVRSKTGVADNQWHHLVGTLARCDNGYTYSIYIDGELNNAITLGQGLTATTGGWIVGTSPGGGYSYKGLIKDLRIYDRALSPTEVSQIYAEDDEGPPHQADPKSALPAPPAPGSIKHSEPEIVE